MKTGLVILATLAVLGVLTLLMPYSGLVNVSALDGHTRLEEWYLSTMSRRSIQARADGISVPDDLPDSTMIAAGAFAYSQMCQTCHGAPGVERSVTGEGMAPQPPRLAEAEDKWTASEIYWIVENGIKMAGMPAYGPTHTDEELWELIAFIRQLPEMTPERYATLTIPDTTTNRPLADDGHDHMH